MPRRRDELLASLIETFRGALVVVDTDLTVVHWNAAMERLTGVARADAHGQGVDGLVAVLDAISLPQYLKRALGGEVTFTAEINPGAWVEAHCVPLPDSSGEVSGAAAMLADISEGRQRELMVGAMKAVGRSLVASLDLNEVLDTITAKTLEAMAADSALVVSWDGQAPEFRVMRAAGRLSDQYATAGAIPVSGGPVSQAVLGGHPVTTPNLLADPRFWVTAARKAQIEREGFKAVAVAPLIAKERVHGALVVHYWTERIVSDQELAALRLLGEQAAVAIDNAQNYAAATRRAERMRELAEVERLVAGSLELDDVLRRIAEATARLLGAPVVHLWTADPDRRQLRLRAWSVEPGVPDVVMPKILDFGEGISGTAAERRVPIFVLDASRDTRVAHPNWWREAGLGTILAVPMISGETLLGVLTVRARPGDISPEEDTPLVNSLAGQATLAIRNAHAYADAVRRGARLRELAALSQSITASLDTPDVMQRIVDAAAGMAPDALAAVHIFDSARNMLRFVAFSSLEMSELPHERPADAGLPGLVFERRQPVLVEDPRSHPRALAPNWWQARPRATYFGAPIMVGDVLLGVLDYVTTEGPPDPEAQEALRLLTAYAGIAIRNASLYQAERSQAARVAALAGINQRISSALELDALLRIIAETAADLTGVKYAVFWLADEERRTLTFKSASAPGIAEDFPQPVVDYGVGSVGWIARLRAPVRIDDIFADERIYQRDWWRRWGVTAFAGYPVLAGEELLAVLMLCHSEPIRFTEHNHDVVDMFIAQASVAIQNARLFSEAQRRRGVAEALARLGREMAGTLDLERIAELVAHGLMELLGGVGSAMYRHEPNGSLHVVACFGDVPVDKGTVLGPGEAVVGRAVAERRIVATRDVLSEPGIQLSPGLRLRMERQAARAVVAVPLVARGHVVGALGLNAESGRVFSWDELRLLQAFADQVALAFENAQLYATANDSLAKLRDTQAQLVQAGKMSALGQLVSGVAHELNNPLSVIIGYGQLLMNRGLPDPLRRPVELMVQQGDRMSKIVRNLLYFARQRPPEHAAVDLNRVIEETLALRVNQLALSRVSVERDFASDLPPVIGDAHQLQQVFLNLLLNAEQAIASAGREGRIVFRTWADDGLVRADVMDSGPGIAPEILPRVFEPFFTTKDVGTGTGLGLSVSYGIVQEHGGRLSVESEPGRTVFKLELPAGASTAATEARVELASLGLVGQGRMALLVEDEPSIVEFVQTLLSETGWRVDVAPGGRTGLDHLRARHYDLVVSDMRMSDGDGEDFYRRAVVADPALAQRFLFVTGDTANERAWDFLRTANAAVLEKPFPPDAFLEAVRRIVAH
jgi:PAS domain S-box-containing protein